MAMQATRVRKNLKANQGRILRVEQLVGRLEKRIERLEKRNAALEQRLAQPARVPMERRHEQRHATLAVDIAKLRIRVDDNAKAISRAAADASRLSGLKEPMRALVRSFKETPGAPFSTWRMWMLSTFRKQGVYRRQMFK